MKRVETREIRIKMADKRISKKELAEETGYSQRSIYRLLKSDEMPERTALLFLATVNKISKNRKKDENVSSVSNADKNVSEEGQ